MNLAVRAGEIFGLLGPNSTIQSGWSGKRRKITPTNPKSGPMTMANESLLSRPPLRSSLRWGVAIAAITAADAHIPIIPDHLHEAPYMGTLFVLLTVTCVGLAAVVLVHDVPLVYVAAVTVCGLAILGYAATRTVAFPQLADDVGNWLEPLGIVALCSEATVIGFSLAALRVGAADAVPSGKVAFDHGGGGRASTRMRGSGVAGHTRPVARPARNAARAARRRRRVGRGHSAGNR